MEFHSRYGQSKKKSNRKTASDIGGPRSSEAARKIKIHNTIVNDDKIGNDNTPDADHHHYHDYDNNSQTEIEAAETLLFMSRQKLDVEDATSLLRVMRVEETKNRGHHHDQKKPRSSKLPKKHPVLNQDPDQIHDHDDHDEAHHGLLQELPQFGYQFDGTNLPRFPPVQRLEELVDNCGTPFVKQLTNTDLSRAQNRLSLNKEDVKNAILPVLNLLNYDSSNLAKGITVSVYDSEGRVYEMSFKTWVGEKVYVLNTKGWKSFVEDRKLIGLRDWMTVWAFTHKTYGNLCFALDINRFPTTKPITKKRLPGSGINIAD